MSKKKNRARRERGGEQMQQRMTASKAWDPLLLYSSKNSIALIFLFFKGKPYNTRTTISLFYFCFLFQNYFVEFESFAILLFHLNDK
jgi:hypothetical protein